MIRALQARSAKRRIWDTGASKGMSHIDSAVGKEMPGPSSSVSTGAGIVQTSAWFKERLPHGESMHVGMAETADTISAGQANMEHGVETLWIEPGSTPADRPGQCILRKRVPGKFSHVVIEGSHQILLPDVVANTPEVADDDSFMQVTGKFCVTPGCKCSLRKLEDVRSSRAFPGQEAAAEQAGGAELAEVPEALEPELEDLDPFRVEQSKQALHSLSGYRCRCPVCVKAKQRRDHAERDSHAHSEARCQTTPRLH